MEGRCNDENNTFLTVLLDLEEKDLTHCFDLDTSVRVSDSCRMYRNFSVPVTADFVTVVFLFFEIDNWESSWEASLVVLLQ